jgi:hypothetical protein
VVAGLVQAQDQTCIDQVARVERAFRRSWRPGCEHALPHVAGSGVDGAAGLEALVIGALGGTAAVSCRRRSVVGWRYASGVEGALAGRGFGVASVARIWPDRRVGARSGVGSLPQPAAPARQLVRRHKARRRLDMNRDAR